MNSQPSSSNTYNPHLTLQQTHDILVYNNNELDRLLHDFRARENHLHHLEDHKKRYLEALAVVTRRAGRESGRRNIIAVDISDMLNWHEDKADELLAHHQADMEAMLNIDKSNTKTLPNVGRFGSLGRPDEWVGLGMDDWKEVEKFGKKIQRYIQALEDLSDRNEGRVAAENWMMRGRAARDLVRWVQEEREWRANRDRELLEGVDEIMSGMGMPQGDDRRATHSQAAGAA